MASPSSPSMEQHLYEKTLVFGLQLWAVIAIALGVGILGVLLLVFTCLLLRNRSRWRPCKSGGLNSLATRIPSMSKEIKELRVEPFLARDYVVHDGLLLSLQNADHKPIEDMDRDNTAPIDANESNWPASPLGNTGADRHLPLAGLPEASHLGWGHRFTLRDLECATDGFSKESRIGEGGYGVVYHGQLASGAPVAIKKLLNNHYPGQAEKDFRAEVDAIGHVRHKNLVRLLGYCVEGVQRLLVYEYVSNGNLETWLHGEMHRRSSLTWDARMNILLGTAKALAYLHEAIEPKVVHRDIKSSNILIDDEFNAKLSDFGLAKLLSAGKTHVSTRVLGTFGYVSPEYASSGCLNEKSDIYSFGVVLLEAITGRVPVDYERHEEEVHLVDWVKLMVARRRYEEVVDPCLVKRPESRDLKRVIWTALRCVDPDVEKRPSMGHVVRMLDSDAPIPREEWRYVSRDRS